MKGDIGRCRGIDVFLANAQEPPFVLWLGLGLGLGLGPNPSSNPTLLQEPAFVLYMLILAATVLGMLRFREP